jgi:hypothetical protein
MGSDSKIKMVCKKTRLVDQKSDFRFWQTQSYQTRIDALEEIRQQYIRWKYGAAPGFQRVYSIVKR